jgi:DNA-binding response OmpR family regulator
VPALGKATAKPALRACAERGGETTATYGLAMAAVLVIEDDLRIRESLAPALVDAGHAVRTEATGAAALAIALEWHPDVIVLDLGLPDIDGADVLRMLRGVSTVPVIVATARDDESEIVRLLDRGADDYVVKPYTAAQLEARIRAVLRRVERRGAGDGGDELVVGGLAVAPERRVATLDGRPLDLTRLEFDLLAHLARRSPEVVSRRELLAEVWRQPYGGADKTVDVHLSWLRRKLGETGTAPVYLHTVRGVGVKLVAPERAG